MSEEEILALVDGSLPLSSAPEVQDHLAHCDICATTWVAAQKDDSLVAAIPKSITGPLSSGHSMGRYEIRRMVGRGGMGDVYQAYDPQLERNVAIKTLRSQDDGSRPDPKAKARFLREAKAMAKLSHPNVITVFDAGEIQDRVFLVMPFLDGPSVAQWLRNERRTWSQVLDVYLAAGRGLAAAHAAGVVHRDFKPQNVMLDQQGLVHVTDFGLAGPMWDPVALTGPTPISDGRMRGGTPRYMAPEQMNGRRADARSDQFSFCVSLYEALASLREIEAGARGATRLRRSSERTIALILERGMSRAPDDRHSSMDELLALLQETLPALSRAAHRPLASGGWGEALNVLNAAMAWVVSNARLAARFRGSWLQRWR